MKFYLLPIVMLAGIFLCLIPGTQAATNAPGTAGYELYTEKIQNFDVNIVVNEDSSLEVTEKIVYDFAEYQKHGIYRDIPYKYKARGGRFSVKLSDFKVVDEKGTSYNYTVTKQGDKKRVKIGDADRYVSGVHTYLVSYKVQRALNYFNEHDELYWNVTGVEWQVPINWSGVTIKLPQTVAEDQLQTACYTGVYGSTASNCQLEIKENGEMTFITDGQLRAYEGLTVVVGWPKGVVTKPALLQRTVWFLQDNYYFFLPFLIFLTSFTYWWVRGRDPKMQGAVVAEYEAPDGLAPAEVGTVIDGKADNKDITAQLIDLAIRGYLKIKQTGMGKKDYQLVKLKEADSLERDFDKKLMEALFKGRNEVTMKDLENSFYKDMTAVGKLLYGAVTSKGYYAKNPKRAKFGCLFVAGVILGIGAFFLGGVAANFFLGVSLFVSGVIMIVFSIFMPKRTKKGVETLRRIEGFKDFLRVTEKERLKFHNPPKMIPEMFEKFLPYAMVLGVEGKWAKNFENIYKQQPDWYEGYGGRSFSPMYLASSMSSFSSRSTSVMTSQPSSASSGGSGFSGGGSGGGGGGGGGGSW
ncbi:MAG: DUF2207 domain-containing protein [Parcubacteria group bacterium]|nr:DUF2207 domain-containing protein [Parcubacteria group bacterium]